MPRPTTSSPDRISIASRTCARTRRSCEATLGSASVRIVAVHDSRILHPAQYRGAGRPRTSVGTEAERLELRSTDLVLLGRRDEFVYFAAEIVDPAPVQRGSRRGALRGPARRRRLAARRRGRRARLRARDALLAQPSSVLRRVRRADPQRERRSRHEVHQRRLRHRSFPAARSSDHRAGHGRRARAARSPGLVARRALLDDRRLRRAGRKPRGRRRARGARGNGRRGERMRVSLVAAVAVSFVAHDRLHRTRRRRRSAARRRRTRGRALVHARRHRGRVSRAAAAAVGLVPPDRTLVRRGLAIAAGRRRQA